MTIKMSDLKACQDKLFHVRFNWISSPSKTDYENQEMKPLFKCSVDMEILDDETYLSCEIFVEED